jgi:UDP-glucuronate 4-epimerase
MLGFTHHQLYNTSFTALRLFTVYGPRTRPDTMAYKLANSIAHQTELPLHNDGKMFRDWIYVSDAADAILAAVDHPMGFEIINVGSGEPVLLSEFIRSMEEIAGAKAVTTTEGMPHSDMRVTFANTSKAKALLGFEPKVKLQHGIACFLSWYQSEVLERSHKPIPAPKKTNGFDVFDFGNGEALSLDGAGELEVIL